MFCKKKRKKKLFDKMMIEIQKENEEFITNHDPGYGIKTDRTAIFMRKETNQQHGNV